MSDDDQNALPAPTGLMVCLLDQPGRAAITTPHPTFSWIMHSPNDDAMQTAFQIRVATHDQEGASTEMFDSRRVDSTQSSGVLCDKLELLPQTAYTWQVRLWDRKGRESEWSEPQAFATGQFRRERKPKPDSSHLFTVDCYPLEVTTVQPASVTKLTNGNLLLDFGRAGFASLDLTLTCPGGCNVAEVHLGEALAGDLENGMHADAASKGEGVCRDTGKSKVRYHKAILPLQQGRHTYRVPLSGEKDKRRMPDEIGEVMPFRFVEVAGLPNADALKSDDARMHVVHYHFNDDDAHFECSNDLLNRVWELCRYSMKATSFCGLFVDGDRERLPYEADAYINQLGYYAATREYTISRVTHEHLIFNPTWPTEWHPHSVMMAYQDYLYTGDDTSIRAFYPDLVAKSLVGLAREDGLISTLDPDVPGDVLEAIHFTNGKQLRDIVDWPLGERDEYDMQPYNTVVNAFHYHALRCLASIDRDVVRAADWENYEQRAEQVHESFNRAFFNESTGLYIDGEGSSHSSLHANMFALCFELVPHDRRPRVVEFVKSKGMACSVYASQYLLEALFAAGEPQHAIDLMLADNDRSWKYMLDKGATMTWEAWANHYKPNQDWNHAWGAAPANIIPRCLMGITPLAGGFGAMEIAPQPGDLEYASIKLPTIRGPIHLSYESSGENGVLEFELPANTGAQKIDLDGLKGWPGHVIDPLRGGAGKHRFEW